MSNKSLVSVIVPFFNEETFIREAIESVFAQTYEDWELLLIDDGSNDDSTRIALRHAEEYPTKVRYLEHADHQNRGMSASRNLGIRHAKGEYIAMLDADDIWLSNKIEQQVAILESHPEVSMIYGPIQWWYSWTENPEGRSRDMVQELRVQTDTVINPPELLSIFVEHEGAAPAGIVVRRHVIEDVGGFEEEFRGMYEDQVFLAKVCLKTPVYASSRCWYRWRRHPNSCCSITVNNGLHLRARVTFLNWLETYLSKQEAKDSETWRILQKELWPYRHPVRFGLAKRTKHLVWRGKDLLIRIAGRMMPAPFRRWLRARWEGREYCPPLGWVHFGSLRRVTPISRVWGYDRGLPIDRYYIKRFLSACAPDIRGRVLEIKDNGYTHEFGGTHVVVSDVLDLTEENSQATIVGDLTDADHIKSETFDCVILTQTLQFIYDARAALKTLFRILKPGGVLLATFPGISRIDEQLRDSYHWNFTAVSTQRLFEEVFPVNHVRIEVCGNVLAATAFLHGLAAQEFHQEELDYCDPLYQVLITVRAIKPWRSI